VQGVKIGMERNKLLLSMVWNRNEGEKPDRKLI
jgi:hypothetical protein